MTKRIGLFFLAFFLAAASWQPLQAEAAGVRYVALGDSLAAGQTPYKEIGASYTDLIALALRQTGQLQSFTKKLAFPGYSTEQVVEQLEKKEAQQLIQTATIITISAGANDLLPLIQSDSVRGTLSYEAIPAAFSLNRVRKNYIQILKKIHEINPNAEVYAIGYYFPYPHVQASQKPAVAAELDLLNKIIEQEAKKAGVHFVPVAEQFGTNASSLIPNLKDVHPAPSGYLKMANSFLGIYAPDQPLLPVSVLNRLPAPISFTELRKEQAGQKKTRMPAKEKKNETKAETKEKTKKEKKQEASACSGKGRSIVIPKNNKIY